MSAQRPSAQTPAQPGLFEGLTKRANAEFGTVAAVGSAARGAITLGVAGGVVDGLLMVVHVAPANLTSFGEVVATTAVVGGVGGFVVAKVAGNLLNRGARFIDRTIGL